MAKLRFYRVPTPIPYSASGAISQELSPIPFTICGVYLDVHANVTTTSVTNFNDYWDRIIANLSLTGQVLGQNKTFFSFSQLRLPHHYMRRELRSFCPRRPTPVAGSQTNALQQFGYLLHFGANPFKPNGDFNWMDLSAGIPATQKGQLTLGGTWAAAGAMGTNTTINASGSPGTYVDVYLYGVQSEPGDKVEDYTPRAWPVWSMTSPTPTATSTTFGTPYSITSGNFLRAIALMGVRGSNAPRDSQIFNSVRLYSQLENREIMSFGGRAGAGDASGGDYAIAELFSQLGTVAPSDDIANLSGGSAAPAVPSRAQAADAGLLYFRLVDYTNKVHPLYGADLRKINTGDLRLDMGVSNATSIAVDLLYARYELNPEAPQNAGLV